MVRKFLALLLSIPLYLCIGISSTLAAEKNFASDYDVSYTVAESGITIVKQEVTITNLTSKFYVSTYSFTIGSEDVRKIKAWDPTGPLIPKVKRKEGEVVITLNFRAVVFGKDRKLKFGISYEFPGLASKDGLLWVVNLLKIVGLDRTTNYKLTLSVPEKFGQLLYSYPLPKTTTIIGTRRLISYTKIELLKGPPRLAFGRFQLYQLHLTYHLENLTLGLGYTEIAFPPDIPDQQQIIIQNFLPKPVSVRTDSDGNYLARYNLGPWEKREVTWEGLVALFYQPRIFGSQKINAISQELISSYTRAAKYWEVEDPAIVAQAQKLLNPKSSAAENTEAIFNFVSNHLSYDYPKLSSGSLTRLGSVVALKDRDKAVCMEFTDLFIALARATGIPAREINGFAYTTDESHRPLSLRLQGGDVLHAWPEIYLPGNGWTMVDPTWSATSGSNYFSVFDLSHIAFVIKGSSSEYPLPAGSYKAGPGQRDVKVSFSADVSAIEQLPQLSIEIDFPLLSVSPFPTAAVIRVRNSSKVTAFNTQLFFESNLLEIDGEKTVSLEAILPGGMVETKARLIPQSPLTRGEQKLIVELSASSFSGERVFSLAEGRTTINPLYLPLPPLSLVVLIAGVILFSYLSRTLLKNLRT